MNVPYNEKTRHIYETIARIAREIAAQEQAQKSKKVSAA